MTPEAQRIAIAEACGWKHRDCTNDAPIIRGGMRYPNAFCALAHGWWREDDADHEGVYASPPDYLADLNACHEMEKVLKPGLSENRLDYIYQLDCICERSAIFATAPQRCEAFLKTLGLWEASK